MAGRSSTFHPIRRRAGRLVIVRFAILFGFCRSLMTTNLCDDFDGQDLMKFRTWMISQSHNNYDATIPSSGSLVKAIVWIKIHVKHDVHPGLPHKLTPSPPPSQHHTSRFQTIPLIRTPAQASQHSHTLQSRLQLPCSNHKSHPCPQTPPDPSTHPSTPPPPRHPGCSSSSP